jgi:uncharacterized protein YjbI with pentapeptide repeats
VNFILANFENTKCQEADFRNFEFFNNTNFENTKCQEADFRNAKFYKETRLQSGGEISDKAIKAIEGAKLHLDNSWYKSAS